MLEKITDSLYFDLSDIVYVYVTKDLKDNIAEIYAFHKDVGRITISGNECDLFMKKLHDYYKW